MKHIAVVLLLSWHMMGFATISTQVSPHTIPLGETFRVVFTIEPPSPDSIPDLTPLIENFSIIGTERSMAYSLVNGEKHSINQWIILLEPLKTGTLPIPAIKIGQEQTTASSIEVTESNHAIQSDAPDTLLDDDVILKTEVSSQSTFINQQIIYTVKLYNHQRLLDAEYQPPQIEDALLIPLGDGRHYETMMNDRNYAVEEQQYAVFPQKSGQLTLVGPSFRALVFGAVPRRINAQGKSITLSVKPIPADYTGQYWLPAKQLALTEVYEQPELSLKQGSTVTRTVTLQASGVPAQLLPNLDMASSPQFNRYPEKPEQRNILKQGDLVGRSDVKVTYILNTSGKVTIPALHVTWFNTTTGKQEVASLPARTLEVLATGHAMPAREATARPTFNKKSALLPKKHWMAMPVDSSAGLARWLSGSLVFIAILSLLVWQFKTSFWIKFRAQRVALKKIHQACRLNKAKDAQEALLRWAAYQWSDAELLNLHHIAKCAHDTALKKQLFILSQALYSQENTSEWKGEALWRSLSSYLRMKSGSKNKAGGLPPINPR